MSESWEVGGAKWVIRDEGKDPIGSDEDAEIWEKGIGWLLAMRKRSEGEGKVEKSGASLLKNLVSRRLIGDI